MIPSIDSISRNSNSVNALRWCSDITVPGLPFCHRLPLLPAAARPLASRHHRSRLNVVGVRNLSTHKAHTMLEFDELLNENGVLLDFLLRLSLLCDAVLHLRR